MAFKQIFLPASILAGTIIGAGVFSLPFVFQAAGLWTGIFYLALAAAIFILEYFLYANIIINTPGEHRLLGYAKLYLGNAGFWVAVLAGLLPLIFSLTIYLVLAPSFFRLIFGDGQLLYLIIFWLIGSLLVLLSTKRIAAAEFLITAALILIMGLIFFLGSDNFWGQGNWLPFNIANLIVLGPVFFALAGAPAIPELVSYFRETKTSLRFLKPAIVLGVIIPAVIYFLFILGVIGLSPQVSQDAVSGLVGKVATPVLLVTGLLGFLAVFSSYVVIGLDARRTLQYDLHCPDWLSRALVIFGPIAFYFLGFQDFLELVSVYGKVFLPIEILLIIFIWLRMRGKI